MKKRNYMRIAAAAMAMVMTVSSVNMPSVVRAENAASQNQMTSEQEIVYANVYGQSTERSQNFDDNWKFYLGDAADAQVNSFDDSKWRQVNLPHDYSIEQDYSASMEAESAYLPGGTGWYRKSFTVDEALEGKQLRIDFGGVYMNATVWVNGTQLGTHPYGYTPFSFDITDLVNYGEENVIAVKVEHQTPSSRWYSGSGIYRSVHLTVMDDVHVDLYGTDIKVPNLETEKGGTVNMDVTTTVTNSGDTAADVVLVHTIYEKGTKNSIGTVTTAAANVAAGATVDVAAKLPAENPKLWDTKNPNLYTVVTEVKAGDTVVDTYETEYGFRYIKFDTNTGFYLNGEKVKLKGVCMHHDQGSLGAEAHRRAIERQVEILQEMGCNSIRVTHNPAADELIEICNEKGILVIDEIFDGWMYHKNGNNKDYATWFQAEIEDGNTIIGAEDNMTWAHFDLQATLNRGKNSPSVIMWSLGNEIQEGAGGSGYHTMATKLIQWAQAENTTQLLTIGSNAVKNAVGNNSNEFIDIGNQLTAVGGPSGTNYSNGGSYDALHNAHPNWFLYGSETASHVNSRGVYDYIGGASQTADKELTSYDYSAVGWGATASSAWYDVITRDFVAGEYVWTGFDYMGEPTPWNGTGSGAVGPWESPKNSYFGIIDTAGLPKDNYYFYQSQWNDDVTTLHVLPAWNDDVVNKSNAKGVPVVVYSDAASVELFLTGTDGVRESLGKKTFTENTTAAGYKYQMYEGADKDGTTHRNMYLTWYVPYEDGMIEAVAYDKNGDVINDTVGRSSVKTTGDEAKLDANVDRAEIAADGKDLAYITVDVTDAEGNIVPDANNNVKVKVEGDGVLVGVDNGKQADHQSFQDDNRDAYNGSMIAIVQSTKEDGSFTVTVESEGLAADTVTVTTTAEEASDTKLVESFVMSKTYYVKTGNQPQLPEKIEVRYTDGTSEEVAVAWDAITEEQIAQTGSFAVQGAITVGEQNLAVSVNVNMIDEIGGLLNYSTNTQVGVEPILPDSRQVVMPDGTILSAAFAVEWDEVEDGIYDQAGMVVVSGKATVFGEEIPVTATVRVQEEEVSVGDVITAKKINLAQTIEEALQSGNLDAVADGNTAYGADAYWSNKAYAAAGNSKSEITFGYDTEQRFGEMSVYFAKNSDAGIDYPAAGSVKLYTSPDGNTWTELETTETIGAESNGVKAYKYSFAARAAERVKVEVNTEAAVGITEIETRTAVGSYSTYSTAGLESLTVNGVEVSASNIAKGSYSTPALFAEVEAVGADNAAVTVLAATKEAVLIIIESEDHETRNVFEIKLGQPAVEDPEDASRDYPIADMTASAGSQYNATTGNEGVADFAIDGNTATHWHTNWAGGANAADVNVRWLGVELKEATLVDGIRSLPRQSGNTNGSTTEYKIQYKLTEDAEWTDVATGNWDAAQRGWKQVSFEPVMAKYVRIVGVHTFADSGNDAHMSMSEFRVQKAANRVNIADEADVTVSEKVTVGIIDENNPAEAEVVVKMGEETLRYGIDYILEYSDNTAVGTATVKIIGIIGYRGTVTKTFEIVACEHPATEVLGKIDATCHTKGYTGDTVCTSCKTVVAKGEEIAMDKHAMVAGEVTKAPTCEVAGEGIYKCTNEGCTFEEKQTIPATGHKAGAFETTKAATCEAAGEKVQKCTVCKAVLKTEAIAATGHKQDAGVVTKKPTAKENGTKTYSCTVCKKVLKTETIKATGESKPSLPKKGAKIVVKGVTYKVTKSASKNGTVSFVKTNSKGTSITIPATIKYKNVSYKVTAIEKNAFKNNKKVKTVVIGKNVNKIGATVFTGCTKLNRIKIQSTLLKKGSLAKTTFKGVKKSVSVTVPKSKVKTYKNLFKNASLNKKVKVTK